MTEAQAFVIAAFLCLFLSAFALITLPSKHGDTLESFILADRKLKQGSIIASLTGTNAALANIVFLFAYWGFTFRGAGLIWGNVFWIAGLLLFLIALRWGNLANLLSSNQKALGINEILGGLFQRKRLLTGVIALASGLTFLFLMSLEVGVGSNAAIRLVSDTPAASFGFSPEALLIGGALVILVSAYGYVGGFPMVVRTDVWQLGLILIGLAAALELCDQLLRLRGSGLWAVVYNDLTTSSYFRWDWSLAPFVLGSLFSWSVWFLCTGDSWQRALAADKGEKARIRPVAILAGMVLLVIVSSASAAIGMTIRYVWSSDIPPAYPVIEFIAQAKTVLAGEGGTTFLLALVIAGFLAAMASTVDTYMVIVGQYFGGDLVRGQPLSSYVDTESEGRVLRVIRLVGILAPLVGLAAFALIHVLGQQNNFTLYMLAGSLPMSLVPVAAWAVWGNPANCKPRGTWTAIGIVFAIVTSLVLNHRLAATALATYDQTSFGLLYFTPFATALVAALFLIVDLKRAERSIVQNPPNDVNHVRS